MSRYPRMWWLHVRIIVLVAVLDLILLEVPDRILNVLAGMILLAVVPGIAITSLATSSFNAMSLIERCMWIVISSFGIDALGGLVLNLTGGLTRMHWIIFLTVGCIGVSLGKAIVDQMGGAITDSSTHWKFSRGMARLYWSRHRSLVGSGARIAFAVLLAVCALLVAEVTQSKTTEHFAELWLVPSGKAPNGVDGTSAVLGVHNEEGRSSLFVVRVYYDTARLPWHTWRIDLRSNGIWQHRFVYGKNRSLRATLYSPVIKQFHHLSVLLVGSDAP